jgi:hypothetical protein
MTVAGASASRCLGVESVEAPVQSSRAAPNLLKATPSSGERSEVRLAASYPPKACDGASLSSRFNIVEFALADMWADYSAMAFEGVVTLPTDQRKGPTTLEI